MPEASSRGKSPPSFRPRFAHQKVGGATRTENTACGSPPLFIVRYGADLGMARGWQIRVPGTHQTRKGTFSRGVSPGESNVQSRGGTTEWPYSWERSRKRPQTPSLQHTNPCGMRSEARKSRRGSTRGNVFSADGGSGRGIRIVFGVSYAMRPRLGSFAGSSRTSTVRRHSVRRRDARG